MCLTSLLYYRDSDNCTFFRGDGIEYLAQGAWYNGGWWDTHCPHPGSYVQYQNPGIYGGHASQWPGKFITHFDILHVSIFCLCFNPL